MVELIAPIPGGIMETELKPEMKILDFHGLEVLAFRGEEAPEAMKEIGRIREYEFRSVGAGRNLSCDLDEQDQGPWGYRHLVSWDRESSEIVAAYRYLLCGDLLQGPGFSALRTSRLFEFSQEFKDNYLPLAVELGRSVVNKQAHKALAGLFSVWGGLGALMEEYSHLKYFFGNFSVYETIPDQAIDALISFLQFYHRPQKSLLSSLKGLEYKPGSLSRLELTGDYKSDYYALLSQFNALGVGLPPILLSYFGASRSLMYLGCSRDRDFGNALEFAILISRDSLTPKTRKRFFDGYVSTNPRRFEFLRKSEIL